LPKRAFRDTLKSKSVRSACPVDPLGNRRMKYRALIFDLDGTLADTLESIACCANQCAEKLGRKPVPVEAFRNMVGEGVRVLAEKFLGSASEETLESFISAFRENLRAWQRRLARPYPGVPGLLEALAERGVKTAVVSNKPHELVADGVRHLFPGHPFVAVLGHNEDTPRKPDPHALLAACELLEADPTETLMVGDTAIDMKAAAAAGTPSVGVLWGFRTARELVEAGAETLVSQPAQILNLLVGFPEITYLATERLVLRPTLAEDIGILEGFWRDRRANLLDHGSPDPGVWTPAAISKLRQCLKRRPSKTMWTILLPPELEVIGYLRLRRRSFLTGQASLGVRLGRAWWGRGYAPEALRRLCRHLVEAYRVRSVELEVLHRNERALRAYRKAGFVPVRKYRRNGTDWQLLRWHAES